MRVLGKQNGMVNSVVRWVSWTHVDSLRGGEGESLAKTLGRNIPERRNSQYKVSKRRMPGMSDEYQDWNDWIE